MIKLLSDLSRVELDRMDKSKIVIIVPAGSQEQHGYLPTGIDILLAEGFARELQEYLTNEKIEALITPTITFGFTPICQGFAGTISLSKDTFQSLVSEVIEELISHGFDKIVIANGHRDNQTSIDEIVTKLSKKYESAKIINPVYALLRTTDEFTRKYPDRTIPATTKVIEELVTKTGLLRHADAAEMSIFYAMYPELKSVYEEKLSGVERLPDLHDRLPSTHDEWIEITKECKGGAGDPRLVDVSLGRKVVNSVVENIYQELFD